MPIVVDLVIARSILYFLFLPEHTVVGWQSDSSQSSISLFCCLQYGTDDSHNDHSSRNPLCHDTHSSIARPRIPVAASYVSHPTVEHVEACSHWNKRFEGFSSSVPEAAGDLDSARRP